MSQSTYPEYVIFNYTVRTGLKDHLQTLNQDAQDCLKSYVLRVVVHKVSSVYMYKQCSLNK